MSHTVVTSFSPQGYREYAHRFIQTFAKHWPENVKCVVFFEEGQIVPQRFDKRIDFIPITEVEGLNEFMEHVTYFPVLCGSVTQQDGSPVYNIQTDARMGRKTFIEAHAAETFGGKVFWIDADVITHSDVPETFLDDMLPDDKLSCYLGRENVYTESGFLGFNTDHPQCLPFLRICRQMFQTGAFLTLPQWHDCTVFDAVRHGLEEQFPKQFVNLGEGVDPGPGLHVFANSRLGALMDHLKGARKGMSRSPDSDLTVKRNEPHWQQAV